MSSDVIFIGGRSGSGKTSVGLELHAQLRAADVTHCLIDGDYLDMAHPTPRSGDLAELNLAAMWSNYRALGYRRMIYVNTVSVLPDVIERLIAAMGDGPNVLAVLLTCTDEVAHERLNRREIGSALAEHVSSSIAMSACLLDGVAASVRQIPTDGRTVRSIAADIRRLANW